MISIRKMDIPDLEQVVNIHMRAFQEFFITFLGASFIRELYKGIIGDESGIAFVCIERSHIIGFICGSTQPKSLYKRLLKRRWFNFGWAAMPSLIKKPIILPRLLRALQMPSQELPFNNCTTLMSIAVDPEKQGCDIGKKLVNEFLNEVKNRGCQYVNLTTDTNGNQKANEFYRSLKFKLHRNYRTPEGREMSEYVIKLFP